jgi:DNA-binding GntR family transcriptional regulator
MARKIRGAPRMLEAPPTDDRRKTDRLFEELKQDIFAGRLLPGDALSEWGLKRSKGVSQTTVRETLFELEHHDLVTRTPRRGTHVTNLTRIDIEERMETRVALEAQAWLLAAPRLVQQDFDQLRRLAQRLEDADAFELDFDFHSYFWTAAQNYNLFRTLDRLVMPMFAMVFLAKGTLQSRHERADSHRAIVDFIERHREPRVNELQDLVRAHIDGAYRHVRHRFRDAREMALSLRAQAARS